MNKEKIHISLEDFLYSRKFEKVNLQSGKITISQNYIIKTQKLLYWITFITSLLRMFQTFSKHSLNLDWVIVLIVGYIVSIHFAKNAYRKINNIDYRLKKDDNVYISLEDNEGLGPLIIANENVDIGEWTRIPVKEITDTMMLFRLLNGEKDYEVDRLTFKGLFYIIVRAIASKANAPGEYLEPLKEKNR